MTLKPASRVLAIVLASASFYALAAPGNNAAVVNGVAIPNSKVEDLLKEAKTRGMPDSPELRQRAIQDLINSEIITQDATKKGLDRSAEVQREYEMMRQRILINAYMKDFAAANKISDAELKQEFERQKAIVGDKQYKVRHILVADEVKAKEVMDQLKKGAKFDQLASKYSLDEGTKANGGQLPEMIDGGAPLVPEFINGVKALGKGQTSSAPVKSQFGYHIIRVDDVKPNPAPKFEEFKGQLSMMKMQQRFEEHVQALRAKAKIEQ